jgi:hypothetical protein
MDKLMMNKLDVMELDMVAGGGTPRSFIPDDHPLNKGFKNGLKTVTKSVDKLLEKIFGSPRRR